MNKPNPKRPLMIIRFRIGQEQPAVWERTLRILKENRAACDEVWFSTGLGTPPLEHHRELSRLMAEHAAELRELGIIPSLQIQSTIGHGDGITGAVDNSARAWGGFTGPDGTECRYCSCPRQPEFLRYYGDVARIYAAWHPGSVWIDDDLRLNNHSPVGLANGCYCPVCLAAFSREEGGSWTREALVEAMRHDDALRLRWLAFGGRSLGEAAAVIVRGFQTVSPETRFGLQHCGDPERNAVFDVLIKESGMRTASRPGGGAYSDHDPYAFLTKGFAMSHQMSRQPGYEALDQICPEIESCPRVFCCKTPQGHRIESMLYLALGMDSLSYFIMDPLYETPEWYGRELLAPLAAEAPCYRDFIAHNAGTMPGGLGLAGSWWHVDKNGLPVVGIPCAAHSPFAKGRMIAKTDVDSLDDQALASVLSVDIILDGEAVEAIGKRGMSDRIAGLHAVPVSGHVFEFYTDDPLNEGFVGNGHYPLTADRMKFELPEETSARVVGEYRDHGGKRFGAASLLLERPDGSRIAALGYSGFYTRYISSARVRFLMRIADWVTHGTLPAVPEEPAQLLLVPRVTADGKLRSVTVLNTVIGPQKPFVLRLRGVADGVTGAEWCVPSHAPLRVELRRTGNEVLVSLPEIAAWDTGWVKLLTDK